MSRLCSPHIVAIAPTFQTKNRRGVSCASTIHLLLTYLGTRNVSQAPIQRTSRTREICRS